MKFFLLVCCLYFPFFVAAQVDTNKRYTSRGSYLQFEQPLAVQDLYIAYIRTSSPWTKQYLKLKWNALQRLRQLKNLKQLTISNSQFKKLPKVITTHKGLKKFTYIAPLYSINLLQIIKLNQLTSLILVDNQIHELPTQFHQLKRLTDLCLAQNQFVTYPEVIHQLPNLKWLNLGTNRLRKIPTSIQQLQKLEQLHLSNNQLTTLPDELGNLTKLKRLYLENNQIHELPSTMQALTNLELLSLKGTPIPIGMRAEYQAMLPNCRIIWE